MFKLGILLSSISLIIPVQAQDIVCSPVEVMHQELSTKYGEEHIVVGQVDESKTVRLYVSPESRDWTIVVVTSTGSACILAFGTDMDVAKGDPGPISFSPEAIKKFKELVFGKDA